jgi:tetratricopeptide (TPR) repeat protein
MTVLAMVVVAGAWRTVQGADATPQSLHSKALESLHRGDATAAADVFSRALSIGNPTPGLLYNAAYTAYRRGHRGVARELAQRALAAAPDDPGALALVALLDLEDGRLPESEVTLRGLLRRHPDHALATGYFGHCLALKGDLAAAKGHLTRALARLREREATRRATPSAGLTGPDPHAEAAEPQLLASLGYVHLRLEEYPAAVEALKRALAIDPSLTTARSHLGLAHYSIGECREAADAFAQVLRARPEDHQARYHLGLALIKQGHDQQGLAELQRIVDKGQPPELVRVCRDLIENGALEK